MTVHFLSDLIFITESSCINLLWRSKTAHKISIVCTVIQETKIIYFSNLTSFWFVKQSSTEITVNTLRYYKIFRHITIIGINNNKYFYKFMCYIETNYVKNIYTNFIIIKMSGKLNFFSNN